MDGSRFDDLVKGLGEGKSRRSLMRGLTAAAIGGVASMTGLTHALAQSRCRAGGQTCFNDSDCCSGSCGAPVRGRRTCSTRTCLSFLTFCSPISGPECCADLNCYCIGPECACVPVP